MAQRLEIHTKEDLLRLEPRLWPFSTGHRVSLASAPLDAARQHGWEVRLNRIIRECGCRHAVLAGAVFIAVFLRYLSPALAQHGIPRSWRVLFGCISFVAAACAGKACGLVLARLRLRRAIRALISQWPSGCDETGAYSPGTEI